MISVIIPVYNAEKVLKKCVDSILVQSYQDLEIILVNDGSQDDSLKVCENLSKSDDRIRVINQKNEGAAVARNTGLDAATGEYIMFVDSDDWIESDMFGVLLDALLTQGADTAICNFYIENAATKDSSVQRMPFPYDFYATEDIGDCVAKLDETGKFSYLWNRLYIKRIINEYHIRFEKEFTTGEDLDFNFKYFQHIQKCVILDQPMYHYIKDGTNSLCSRYKESLYEIVTELNRRRKAFYHKMNMDKNNEYQRIYEKTYVEYICTCVPNMYRKNAMLTKKDRLLQWNTIINDEYIKDYLENYQPTDFLLRLFKHTVLKGNTESADCFYSLLFWIRNNHPRIYRLLKR